MVRLTVTQLMLEGLQYCEDNDLNLSAEDALSKGISLGRPVSHGQVIALWQLLRQYEGASNAEGSSKYTLAKLLNGSEVYIEPAKPKPEPTPKFKALMARLREEEEERQYERMINPPLRMQTFGERFPNSGYAQLFPQASRHEEDEEVTFADVNRQVTLIFNILISIIACAVAIWMATKYWPIPQRIGASMGGGGLVGVAEVVVYAGYLRRVKEAKHKEKKKVEKKEIIDTWVSESKNQSQDSSDFEKLIPATSESVPVRKRLTHAKDKT